jgi:hypothetical protein
MAESRIRREVVISPLWGRPYLEALGLDPNALRPQREVWIEADVSSKAQPGAVWKVAYLLVNQGGVPVVAEMRLFPAEPHPFRPAGQWSGHVAGVSAPVPPGGITSRLIREVHLGKHLRYAGGEVASAASPPPRRRSDRRSRLPEIAFARAAETYDAAVKKNEGPPVPAVARRHRLSIESARWRIHEARVRGFLTTTGQGRAGGRLTDRGKRVLRTKTRRR